MAEIACLSGSSDWIDLEFVERERTPRRLMELSIRLYLSGLSLSDTISELEKFGVQRSRIAVHDWVQKAYLQPADGVNPNHVAVDETVIRINDQKFWLYAAVDPDSNKILHLQLFATTTTVLTERFLQELREKHDVEAPCFSSMAQNTSKLHSNEQGPDFSMNAAEIGIASNVSFIR